tara:strand:- start:3391 stop:3579 length:189 start_codon:yes stop_codon:yes gene_type:complete
MFKEEPRLKDEFLTRNQVAELCHCTPATVLRWDKIGIVKSYGFGVRCLYKKQEILSLIEGGR